MYWKSSRDNPSCCRFEKVSNFLDDRKEAVVTTPLSEKKSLTKDVDKGTDELEDMKEAVFPIRRKDLDKFWGQ